MALGQAFLLWNRLEIRYRDYQRGFKYNELSGGAATAALADLFYGLRDV